MAHLPYNWCMSTTLIDVVTLPRLAEIRLRRAYSQRDLAKAAHVSPRTVAYAEAGDSVSLRTQRKLAEVLKVEPHELLEVPAG
jgi:transcriptional regulator with XRE-family HTH domain